MLFRVPCPSVCVHDLALLLAQHASGTFIRLDYRDNRVNWRSLDSSGVDEGIAHDFGQTHGRRTVIRGVGSLHVHFHDGEAWAHLDRQVDPIAHVVTETPTPWIGLIAFGLSYAATRNTGLSLGVAASAAAIEATVRRRYPAAHFELGETLADGRVHAIWVEPKRLAA